MHILNSLLYTQVLN